MIAGEGRAPIFEHPDQAALCDVFGDLAFEGEDQPQAVEGGILQHLAVIDDERPVDPNAEYAIVVSMYEVYNDRIFDLLTGSATGCKNGAQKRRALLFKSTEQSPDRKVVAGLRKIVCGSLEEALMVLETGLVERRVAGTGSNAVSSRSHGFFCVEVKKRNKSRRGPWTASTLTIVDLAGNLYLLSQDGEGLIRYCRIRACEARKDCRGYTC